MTFSRRSLFRFSAATAVGAEALPAVARALERQQQAVETRLAEPAAVHTYEEGVDQAPVVAGYGVALVIGTPIYSATDRTHDNLGWLSPATAVGGVLVYPNPNVSASSGSVYLTPHAVGATAAAVLALLKGVTTASAIVKVRLRADFHIDVVLTDGSRLALSKLVWTPDQPLRLDWQQTWDGRTFLLTVWLFVGSDLEGWRPSEVLVATHASLSPVNIALGSSSANTSVGFDTYREYATAGMPPPFVPPVGIDVVHSYDGGVEGQPVLPGFDMVRSAGGKPTYSAAAALHGAMGVVVPAARLGATLTYDNPYPPAHTGSIYVRTQTRGKGDSQVVSVQNGFAVLTRITMRPSGSICITDSAGNVLAETTGKAKTNVWTRIDWQVTWDGARLAITVRYLVIRADATVPYTQITASVPCTVTPDTLVLGTPASTWQLHLDTFRTYGDVTYWPAPFAPIAQQVYSLVGGPAPDGTLVTVASDPIDVGKSVVLAYSTTAEMTDPLFTEPQTVDSDGLTKHQVVGLLPLTQYFLQPSGVDLVPFGEQCRVKTLPADTGAWSMKIHLGSCQTNTPTSNAAWLDIEAWAPDMNIFAGDDGYWGGSISASDPYTRDLDRYRTLYTVQPALRRVHQMAVCGGRTISDHELYDNGDYNARGNLNGGQQGAIGAGIFESPMSKRELIAFQKLMPIANWGDVREPRRGRYYSYHIGAKVNVIVLDFRSPDRSNAPDVDGPEKTMLGATQLAWLFSVLDPLRLNLLVLETSWVATQIVSGGVASDKPWNYPTEQNMIAARINGTDSTGIVYPCALLGGDRHYVGYLDGASNPIGGFPCYIGSGWEKNGLPLAAGEVPTWQFGAVPPGSPVDYRTVIGYLQLVLSDDGANNITLAGTARVADTRAGVFALSTPEGMTCSNTWTLP